jgi:hypothetical protein
MTTNPAPTCVQFGRRRVLGLLGGGILGAVAALGGLLPTVRAWARPKAPAEAGAQPSLHEAAFYRRHDPVD